MHETIMNFSSEQFYDGNLQADDTVRHHTLDDLDVQPPYPEARTRELLDPDVPLVFADTRNLDAAERSREGSTSKENRTEAEIVSNLARQFLNAGLEPHQVAVIAPYDDQVDLIDERIDREDLEVKTVDGFQGREKEVILISMTRSNVPGTIGFLDEERRFNVALTRAKRKAVVVGDSSTICSDPLYQDFIEYVDHNGSHVELSP